MATNSSTNYFISFVIDSYNNGIYYSRKLPVETQPVLLKCSVMVNTPELDSLGIHLWLIITISMIQLLANQSYVNEAALPSMTNLL